MKAFLHVAVGQAIAQVPPHRHHDHLGREPEPAKAESGGDEGQEREESFTGQACLDLPVG
jgi:hypothetical protein